MHTVQSRVSLGAHDTASFARSRWAGIAVAFALLGGMGCGVRTAISAESDLGDNADVADGGGHGTACGFGPPCDPYNFGSMTCESLGRPAGPLSCDPKTCFLVLTGCGRSGDVSGGPGTSATGSPSGGTTPLFGAGATMDGGALFGGLFGAGQAGQGGQGPMAGSGSMADEDGGMAPPPPFFGGANNGGFFGGANNGGFFGGANNGGFFGGANTGGIFGGGTGNGQPGNGQQGAQQGQ